MGNLDRENTVSRLGKDFKLAAESFERRQNT